VLLPVVALGRAQELLLILEEYWSRHPELHGVPIYQVGVGVGGWVGAKMGRCTSTRWGVHSGDG
jgi:hypothetical protein